MNWAHIHLAVNHFPFVGTALAALTLGSGLALRNRGVARVGLALLAVAAASAVAAYFTGEPAEHSLRGAALAETLIEAHEEAALVAFVSLALVGSAAGFLLLAARLNRAVPAGLERIVLFAALISLGLMAWTNNRGGRIRHPEIAPDFAPADIAAGEAR